MSNGLFGGPGGKNVWAFSLQLRDAEDSEPLPLALINANDP